MRKGGNRIRITAQLIDTESGAHVWAERYDRQMDDIFAVQDEITLIVATELQVSLTEGEQARLRYSTTDNVEAWTHWVKGLAFFRGGVAKDAMGRARPAWEKALELDPDCADAYNVSSMLNAMRGDFRQAHADAARAVDLAPGSADIAATAGFVFACVGEPGRAVVLLERAMAPTIPTTILDCSATPTGWPAGPTRRSPPSRPITSGSLASASPTW